MPADPTPPSCSYREVHVADVIAPLALDLLATSKALSLSDRTTWGLLKSGRLRGVRVGTRWLVPVVEIARFLEREVVAGQQAQAGVATEAAR
jgi:excisionase family DNA binding protein